MIIIFRSTRARFNCKPLLRIDIPRSNLNLPCCALRASAYISLSVSLHRMHMRGTRISQEHVKNQLQHTKHPRRAAAAVAPDASDSVQSLDLEAMVEDLTRKLGEMAAQLAAVRRLLQQRPSAPASYRDVARSGEQRQAVTSATQPRPDQKASSNSHQEPAPATLVVHSPSSESPPQERAPKAARLNGSSPFQPPGVRDIPNAEVELRNRFLPLSADNIDAYDTARNEAQLPRDSSKEAKVARALLGLHRRQRACTSSPTSVEKSSEEEEEGRLIRRWWWKTSTTTRTVSRRRSWEVFQLVLFRLFPSCVICMHINAHSKRLKASLCYCSWRPDLRCDEHHLLYGYVRPSPASVWFYTKQISKPPAAADHDCTAHCAHMHVLLGYRCAAAHAVLLYCASACRTTCCTAALPRFYAAVLLCCCAAVLLCSASAAVHVAGMCDGAGPLLYIFCRCFAAQLTVSIHAPAPALLYMCCCTCTCTVTCPAVLIR